MLVGVVIGKSLPTSFDSILLWYAGRRLFLCAFFSVLWPRTAFCRASTDLVSWADMSVSGARLTSANLLLCGRRAARRGGGFTTGGGTRDGAVGAENLGSCPTDFLRWMSLACLRLASSLSWIMEPCESLYPSFLQPGQMVSLTSSHPQRFGLDGSILCLVPGRKEVILVHIMGLL